VRSSEAKQIQANPSPNKQNQIKLLGFIWFYSSESGLFNGLRRIQIKSFLPLGRTHRRRRNGLRSIVELSAVEFVIARIIAGISSLRKIMSINSGILLEPIGFTRRGSAPPPEATYPTSARDSGVPRLAIAGVAERCKAKKHHRPGGRFGAGAPLGFGARP
jgi:hypothetical protein